MTDRAQERRRTTQGPGTARSLWAKLVLAAVVAWAAIPSSAQLAAPVNDFLTNAIPLYGGTGATNGSTIGATRELFEPYTGSGGSVWYRWTAPTNGVLTLDTIGTYSMGLAFDTVLSVFVPRVPGVLEQTNLVMIAQNDDYYNSTYYYYYYYGYSYYAGLDSLVSLSVVEGVEYIFALGGFGGDTGYYVMHWNMPNYSGSNSNLPVPTLQSAEVAFAASSVTVAENRPGYATVAVAFGGGVPATVSVEYFTWDASAVGGLDYIPRAGTLTFAPGESNQFIQIPIIDNAFPNSNKVFYVSLTNASGGAVMGAVSNMMVVIQDDETVASPVKAGQFQFSAATYRVFSGEGSAGGRSAPGAIITVTRTNGYTGRVMVDYFATNALFFGTNLIGTNLFLTRPAVPGLVTDPFVGYDYRPVSGTLVLDDYQMSTNFLVPVLGGWSDYGIAQVLLSLSNPRPWTDTNNPALSEDPTLIQPTLGSNYTAVVNIVPSFVTGYASITRAHYRTDEFGATRFSINVNYPGGGTASVGLGFIRSKPTSPILNAGSDYAEPGVDFVIPNRIVTIPAPYSSVNVEIPIVDDSLVEFNEDFHPYIYQLYPGEGPGTLPPVNPYAYSCNVTILSDDEPPGAIDREWNPNNVISTIPPANLAPGANFQVRAVAVQPDGKCVAGGDFSSYNTVQRRGVVRINADGSLDSTFDPGNGADGFVQTVTLYSTNSAYFGRTLISGGFSSYNGARRNGIARLNPNGSLDATFTPGNGADAPVRYVFLRADNKILIAGDFLYYNDVWRNGVALLNEDGSLDMSFSPALSLDGVISAVAAENPTNVDSSVYIGGSFTTVNGQRRGSIARLDSKGALDFSFNPGAGADGPVYSIAPLDDGRLYIAGGFTNLDMRLRSGVARLNSDGSLDATFNPGLGVEGTVYCLTLDSNNRLLLGGRFHSYNATRRMGLARVQNDGTLDTTFMDTAFNQFAGMVKQCSFDADHFINSIALQPDGNFMIGGSFTNVGGNPSVRAPARFTYVQFTRADKMPRFNIARLIGTWGTTDRIDSVTNIVGTVTNIDTIATPISNPPRGPGNTEFAFDSYTVDEYGVRLLTTLWRVDGTLGTLGAVATTEDRTGFAGTDYTGQRSPQTWNEWAGYSHGDGSTALVYWNIPIINNTLRDGDRTVNLHMSEPFGSMNLGGEYIPLGGALGVEQAMMTISDDDVDPGTLLFSQPSFSTNEISRYAVITVTRTNGARGTVTADYYTANGTARAGFDYRPAGGTLTFEPGVSNATFRIELIDNFTVDFDRTVLLILTNATGGAHFGSSGPTASTVTTLTIIDDDYAPGRLNFAATTFHGDEGAPAATVTVTRTGGSTGDLRVWFRTADGSAMDGLNYSSTNSWLYWPDGDSQPQTFEVPLRRDGLVTGDLLVKLNLYGVSRAAALGGLTNAQLIIHDVDSYGAFAFNQAAYRADENGTNLLITVVRTGGAAGPVSVDFLTAPGTGMPGVDYYPTNGTLTFASNDTAQVFKLLLVNNTTADGNRTVNLLLSNPSFTNAFLGDPAASVLTIVDDESFNVPAGSLDTTYSQQAQANDAIYSMALLPDSRLVVAGDFTSMNGINRLHLARLKESGSLDPSFNSAAGPDGPIRTLALQPDGRMLLGGSFTNVNGTNRLNIARMTIDGALDASFDPGAGADSSVYAIALQAGEKILIGGNFSKYNGYSSPGIARLNTNGVFDATFNTGAGANGKVYAIVVQNDGKVVIGGDFTQFNGVPCGRVVRLNVDGSLDAGFRHDVVFESPVRALLFQADGRLIVGGSFTNISGAAFPAGTNYNYLARLLPDGALDTAFLVSSNPATGQIRRLEAADGAVYVLKAQVDGRVLVGGEFSRFNGVTRNRLTRLDPDGATDPSINFGNGANSFVTAIAVQQDRNILIGGGFTSYDDQPRDHLARIYGGSISGAGRIEFSPWLTAVSETVSNVTIHVRRVGGTAGPVSALASTVDGSALAGLNYTKTTGLLEFPEGETRLWVTVPILNQNQFGADRFFTLELSAFTGGASPGAQSEAFVRVLSSGSIVSFATGNYSVNENDVTGHASLGVTRRGATNTTVSVTVLTVTNIGTALAGVRYLPTNQVITFAPGQTLQYFTLPVLNSTAIEGNQTVALALAPLTGRVSLDVTNATLTIIDDDNIVPGEFVYSSSTYTNNRSEVFATITVLRTNGSSGIASVRFNTPAGGTAVPGVNYTPTNGILSFADGETVKIFRVMLPSNWQYGWQGDRTVRLVLSSPTGGARLGPVSNATLVITDNKPAPAFISFTTNYFEARERQSFASIIVTRSYNLSNAVSVTFATTNGSARPGEHYLPTNGVMTFAPNEGFKTILVTLVNTNGLVEPDRSVGLVLLNPVPAGSSLGDSNVVLLGSPAQAVLSIRDDDTGLQFSQTNYVYPGGAGVALISVVRSGVTNRPVQVDYRTPTNFVAASGLTALPGIDYLPTNGTLSFASGVNALTFGVELLSNYLVRADRVIPMVLSNLIGDAVLVTPRAVITLTNVTLSPGVLLFAAPSYSVAENGTNAHLTVLRTNGTYGVVTVDYISAAGSAVPGLNFVPVSGTLSFADGQSSRQIDVPIIDDRRVEGNKYFTVTLGTPSGNAQLAGFGAARVVIVEDDSGPGTLDMGFDPGAGANSTVQAVAVQPDGKIVMGGTFTAVDALARNHLARLESYGALDTNFLASTFSTNVLPFVTYNTIDVYPYYAYSTNYVMVTNVVPAGPDGAVLSVGVQTNGGIVMAGVFSNFTAVSGAAFAVSNVNRLGRLLPDGSLDSSFARSSALNAAVASVTLLARNKLYVGGGFSKPKSGILRSMANGAVDTGFDPGSGANGVVYATAETPDGGVVLGGEFSTLAGSGRARVARLNGNGALDLDFIPPADNNGVVYDVLVQPDGKIIIAGDFTLLSGAACGRLARLNTDGSLDASFMARLGSGASDAVYALALQPDGKILIAGDFLGVSGAGRNRLARLNSDGSLDTAYEVGYGANNTIFALALQPDGRLVLAGSFTEVFGVPRGGIARVYGDQMPFRMSISLTAGRLPASLGNLPYGPYIVAASTNLRSGWTDIATNLAPGLTNTFSDPEAGAYPQRFYRVRTVK